LSVGKWVHNAGGIMMLVIFAALLLLPIISVMTHHLHDYHPLRASTPAFTLFNVNILAKMGFGALGGFEYVAILAGETRSPARSITRSVWIAAPVIAVMFILGTSTVVAFIPANDIDLIGPMPQVLRVGFAPFGITTQLVTLAIVMSLGIRIAQASVNFTGITRLPMVAGWDRLLPAWFTRLHANYRTPVNSILLVGVTSLVIAMLSLIGVGQAESFQLLFNAGGTFYALTYVVLFAIPLFGLRQLETRPPVWLRIASLSGLIMTLGYVVLSVFPIIQVTSAASFALKISLLIIGANVVGVLIFLTAKRQRATGGLA
jgi:amino acid transporter